MRGEHRSLRTTAESHRRFIPACAGNTSLHACSSVGSSPHARGTPLHANRREASAVHPRMRGEHEAYRRRRRLQVPGPSHPRVCGEHRMAVRREGRPVGSAPRVRGTHSPPPPWLKQPAMVVYPCACWNTQPARHHNEWSGSSPRVRGTYTSRDFRHQLPGQRQTPLLAAFYRPRPSARQVNSTWRSVQISPDNTMPTVT